MKILNSTLLVVFSLALIGCEQPWKQDIASFDSAECKTFFTEREAEFAKIQIWLDEWTDSRPTIEGSDLVLITREDVDALVSEFDSFGYPFLGDKGRDCERSLTGSRLVYLREFNYLEFGPSNFEKMGYQLEGFSG